MEYLANFFLVFGNHLILTSLIIIGFAISPKTVLAPTLLFFFTMTLNPLLKSFFNIPFPAELVIRLGKEGFSFPSGHMQATCVFYGWFIVNNKNKLIQLILTIIIVGNGFGIIYNRYHNIYDILAAVFFAFLTIGLYKIISYQTQKGKIRSNLKKLPDNLIEPASLIFGLSCFLIFALGYFYKIPTHSIMALYSILGIMIGLKIGQRLEKSEYNSYQFVLAVSCLILVYYLISIIQFDNIFLQQLRQAPIATILPLLYPCLKNLRKNYLK